MWWEGTGARKSTPSLPPLSSHDCLLNSILLVDVQSCPLAISQRLAPFGRASLPPGRRLVRPSNFGPAPHPPPMPKSTVGEYPLNGLVAINKVSSWSARRCLLELIPFFLLSLQPSGQTSMTILDGLKRLGRKSVLLKEEAVKGGSKPRGGMTKIGQGGTLDPLADGVLGECEAQQSRDEEERGGLTSELTRTSPPLFGIPVVGLGKGTKELNRFLLCSKVKCSPLSD